MNAKAAPKVQGQLWTVHEAAAYLRMSPSWLYKAAGRGEVPHCRIGFKIRFNREQLERWTRGERTPVALAPVSPIGGVK